MAKICETIAMMVMMIILIIIIKIKLWICLHVAYSTVK